MSELKQSTEVITCGSSGGGDHGQADEVMCRCGIPARLCSTPAPREVSSPGASRAQVRGEK